ncbi:MAG: hypothetical protein AB7T01_02290 [Acidithiobacillus sp.]
MATVMMQRNNLADAFVAVGDADTNAALKAARDEIGDAEWKKGFSPEKKTVVREAMKAHNARYEEKLIGSLVGVDVAETQANGETFKKLRVTLENDNGKTILSSDLNSEHAQRLLPKLATAIGQIEPGSPAPAVVIGGFASEKEKDGRTFVDHVATLKDAEGKEFPAQPGHFEAARDRAKVAQKPLLDAGMSDKKVLKAVATSAREAHFAEVAEDLSARLKSLGIAPQETEKAQGAYPALEAGIKDREGHWHNLSLYEKDGELMGTLQRRIGKGEYEKVPLSFQSGDVGGMQANASFPDGSEMLVSLARSEPSEIPDAQVAVAIFSRGKDLEGAEALEPIHDRPRSLRANEALAQLGENSREAQLIKERFSVDMKGIAPYKAPPLPSRAPASEKQQEVQR